MRTLLPLALIVACVLALTTAVRGEDPVPLDARVEALAREVAWLRAREARLTGYIVANGARGDALERLAQTLRAGGFASHANPTQARETLLKGLEDLAVSLKAGLPTLTDAERAAQAGFASR
jgi:hypothetical protein